MLSTQSGITTVINTSYFIKTLFHDKFVSYDKPKLATLVR